MQSVVSYLQERYRGHPHATLRLSIMASGMEALNAETVPLNHADYASQVLDCLLNILNSKDTIPLDEHFKIHTTITNLPPLPVINVGAGTSASKGDKAGQFVVFPPSYPGGGGSLQHRLMYYY